MFTHRKTHRRKSSRHVISSRSRHALRHDRDFHWKPGGTNPYAKEETPDTRRRLEIAVVFASLCTVLAIGLFHPFFSIRTLVIEGTDRIGELEFRGAILGAIDGNIMFVLPRKNYFLVDAEELGDIIRMRFPIESVVIRKIFPNTLDISIEEKLSTIIYDTGNEYSYLGLDGNIIEVIRKVGEDEWYETTRVVTTTLADGSIEEREEVVRRFHVPPIKQIRAEMGEYPVLYDARNKTPGINDTALRGEIVSGIISWYSMIDRNSDVPFAYVVIDDELGDATIVTEEGWEVRVKLDERVGEQFEDMQYVLREKVTRPNLKYIDVRFDDRVYWQ
ncbi:MAG: hypothetical protein A3C90_02545 [Candidatus Magasanikbacteria bacterium RIFCSPHIGHO2_02_FULL_51_14]|uniref:POTRA domain-containing protein n=1 Tax=Candidatus Magasanikbacteria bacterium RIFCSPHIGHO2_02_FULL_51_14 TaxID=1798683 RepID=A0A1F6MD76_9BACT|nr:MAG: hypothetical protein A3C90_02545 [Candidatus Magasanikbacteria bacterium RIFCSPHIGHO2_02_FULL_51_14]